MKLPSNIKDYFSQKHLTKIISFMIKDKKNVTKKINLIMIKDIGTIVINNEYNSLKIKKFLKRELLN